MRKSFLLYLFVIAALLAVFVYVSGNRRMEAQKEEIVELQEDLKVAGEKNDSLYSEITRNSSFSLQANEKALAYLEDMGLDPAEVAQKVEDVIISRNKADADNDLVPYEGMEGFFRVNKVKLLNHKWLIASFTDGTYWGDLLISYEVGPDGNLELNTEKAILYPRD